MVGKESVIAVARGGDLWGFSEVDGLVRQVDPRRRTMPKLCRKWGLVGSGWEAAIRRTHRRGLRRCWRLLGGEQACEALLVSGPGGGFAGGCRGMLTFALNEDLR